jgi:RNA polymerase sigma factor (TIGR02999 family)
MPSGPSTTLLLAWRNGNRQALDQLIPLLYDELARIARGAMSAERRDHTLQTRALVHEAYLRLIDADLAVQGRAHFLALAARTMRRVLTDHARARGRIKRGADSDRVSLTGVLAGDEAAASAPEQVDLIDLDHALQSLARQDAQKAQILEMLYFGGLTYEEIAAALDISRASIGRELQIGRAWLARSLGLGRA